MRFGLLANATAPRSQDATAAARGFEAYAETCVEAEALGYESSFLVEHHFAGSGQVAATLHLQQWIAARTRSLRLGTAVLVLPWHNPVLLAEQVATVDLLSGGRLELGIGRGYRWSEFRGFGMPPEDAADRFEECLSVLLRALTATERFTHTGSHWTFRDILVEPSPAQRPHPPIWMAASGEAGARAVAARGFDLLIDQFASPLAIAAMIGAYQAEGRARAHIGRVAVARTVRLAETPEAIAAVREDQAAHHLRMIALSRGPAGRVGQRSHILAHAGSIEATLAHALIGTPDMISTGINDLRQAGVQYVLMDAGPSPQQTLRRLARDVLPAFL